MGKQPIQDRWMNKYRYMMEGYQIDGLYGNFWCCKLDLHTFYTLYNPVTEWIITSLKHVSQHKYVD